MTDAAPAEILPFEDNRDKFLVRSAQDLVAISPDQRYWTAPQRAAFAAISLDQVPTPHLIAFFHICKSTGLDPFRREIYLIGRQTGRGANKTTKYTAQTGIDGFRHTAQRTGRYIRTIGPFWTDGETTESVEVAPGVHVKRSVWFDTWGRDTPPVAARVIVEYYDSTGEKTSKDVTAHYAEFVPLEEVWEDTPNGRRATGQKKPGAMWAKMGAHMIGKCCEALALRQAFPRELAGVYSHEEMQQADVQEKALADRESAAARRLIRQRQEVAAAAPAAVEGELVVDDTPVVTRDDLIAELTEQAAMFGQTLAESVSARWLESQGITSLDEATDVAVGTYIYERAGAVVEKLTAEGEHDLAEVARRGELHLIPTEDPERDRSESAPEVDEFGLRQTSALTETMQQVLDVAETKGLSPDDVDAITDAEYGTPLVGLPPEMVLEVLAQVTVRPAPPQGDTLPLK